MILNFDQPPLDFTKPNKATFAEKGIQSLLVANIDDKRQKTSTFWAKISGEFLRIQLIYSDVTEKCTRKWNSLAHPT